MDDDDDEDEDDDDNEDDDDEMVNGKWVNGKCEMGLPFFTFSPFHLFPF